jgi:hypothetical protein
VPEKRRNGDYYPEEEEERRDELVKGGWTILWSTSL